MRQGKRIITLMLSLLMILAFMPAMAFAEGEEPDIRDLIYEGDGPQRLYSDGSAHFRLPDGLHFGNGESPIISVGLAEFNEDGPPNWQTVSSDCYDFDQTFGTITLFGNKMPDFIYEAGHVDIAISSAENNWLSGNSCEFRKAWEPFYETEENRDLVPGWNGWIDKHRHVYADNEAYPDFNGEYTVINVTHSDGDMRVLERFDTEEDGWYYEVKRDLAIDILPAEVTFNVTYEDLNGAQKEYSFKVTVAQKVYELDLWSDNGYNMALPGEPVGFSASGRKCEYHDYGDEWSDIDDRPFDWKINEGSDFASIAPDSDHPAHATVWLGDMGSEEYFERGVEIEVTYNGDDGEEISRKFWLNVSSDFYQIAPAEMNRRLDVGCEQDVQFEVNHYYMKDGAGCVEPVQGITYEICDLEENKLEQIKGDSGTGFYTFRRISPEPTDFQVIAHWEEEHDGNMEPRDIERWFRFDDRNYDVWFSEHDGDVYDDGEWTIDLMTNEDLNYEHVEYVWEYRGYVWNENTQEDVEVSVNASKIDALFSNDHKSITMTGTAMKELGITNLQIIVRSVYNGEVMKEGDCWFHLKEDSCTSRGEEHLWLSVAPDYADCYSPGIQKQMCWHCHEKRYVKVDPRGHLLVGHAAVPATLSAEGKKAYWECTECHKLFSDAAGTKSVEAGDLVIPVLIDIKGASVTGIKNLTYTGKALTQAPVVKLGSATLKAGTDYTLTYAKNKDVGTATVTIVGAGAYGGSLSKTFVINPAGTKLTSLKAGKKLFTANWTKQAAGTTGYEVQYALNSGFTSSPKTVNIGKNATVKTTVKKLKAKKTYYVRIRTYKTVGGKKFYSAWSASKKVKVK